MARSRGKRIGNKPHLIRKSRTVIRQRRPVANPSIPDPRTVDIVHKEYPMYDKATIAKVVTREQRLHDILNRIAELPTSQFFNVNKFIGCAPGKSRAEASISIYFRDSRTGANKKFDITVLMEGGKTVKQVLDNALRAAAEAAISWGYEPPTYDSSRNTEDSKFTFNYIDCAPTHKMYDNLTK